MQCVPLYVDKALESIRLVANPDGPHQAQVQQQCSLAVARRNAAAKVVTQALPVGGCAQVLDWLQADLPAWKVAGVRVLRVPCEELPLGKALAYLNKRCLTRSQRNLGAEMALQILDLPQTEWIKAPEHKARVPGMCCAPSFRALAARLEAELDRWWARWQSRVAGLEKPEFVEALVATASAVGRPLVGLYAPAIHCEAVGVPRGPSMRGMSHRPSLLATTLLPVVKVNPSLTSVDVQDGYAGELHRFAGFALSYLGGGLLGNCGKAARGVSLPVAIMSSPCTSALVHVEDCLFISYNLLLLGAPKVWYLVPADRAGDFLVQVRAMLPLEQQPFAQHLLATKSLHLQLSPAAMQCAGVVRIVQQAGEIVLTPPGVAYHWTLSTGFSIAESVNLLLPRDQAEQTAHWEASDAYMADLLAGAAELKGALPETYQKLVDLEANEVELRKLAGREPGWPRTLR